MHHLNPVLDQFVEHTEQRKKSAALNWPKVTTAEVDQHITESINELRKLGVKVDDPFLIEQLLLFHAAMHESFKKGVAAGYPEAIAAMAMLGKFSLALVERGKLLKVIE